MGKPIDTRLDKTQQGGNDGDDARKGSVHSPIAGELTRRFRDQV